MTDERTKNRILARRAQLVAAAISVACSPTPETKPSVCLEPIILPPEDSGAAPTDDGVRPTVCLSPMAQPQDDAGTPAAQDSGVAPPKDAGVKDSGAKPNPQPCLSPARPTVCLKPMQPPPNVCLYIKK